MFLVPTIALVTVSVVAASTMADASTSVAGTRNGYVVGGELIVPAPATVEPASGDDSAEGETRHGYVVGGALVRPAR
jgi:hypothetical protein